MDYNYKVYDPCGLLVLQGTLDCRYPAAIELRLLDAGYTIKINGRKLTKKEARLSDAQSIET